MIEHGHPLRIIATDLLRPLSVPSDSTSRRIAAGMAADGVQKNPVAVALVDSGEYIILDGVSRWDALRRLGIRDTMTQIVDLDDPQLKLSSWSHIVKHLTAGELEKMASRQKLDLTKTEKGELLRIQRPGADDLIALLDDGVIYRFAFDRSDLIAFNNTLFRLVSAYSANSQVIRLPLETLIGNSHLKRPGEAHILLPTYTQPEVMRVHESGNPLPPHTLCYSFPCRYLGIKLSLEILSQDVPSDDKNGFLDELIRIRLSRSRAAFYPQSVFLMND